MSGPPWVIWPEFSKSQVLSKYFHQIFCVHPRWIFSRNRPPPGTVLCQPRQERSGHREQSPIWPSILLKGPGWDVPDRVRQTWTYMAFFSIESDRPICSAKFPKSPIWPICVCKADRLIIILFHYNYNIFFYKSQIPDR